MFTPVWITQAGQPSGVFYYQEVCRSVGQQSAGQGSHRYVWSTEQHQSLFEPPDNVVITCIPSVRM